MISATEICHDLTTIRNGLINVTWNNPRMKKTGCWIHFFFFEKSKSNQPQITKSDINRPMEDIERLRYQANYGNLQT